MNLWQTVQHTEQQLLQAGVSFGHGTTNALDEAAWLVLHALGRPLDTPLHEATEPLSPTEQAAVAQLLQQRLHTRKPLAYLIQQAWLQGLSFYVDERAIVPRSLIAECLADGSIDPWLPAHITRVLDLCTGNGSLAVLAALAWPEAQVDAADLSAPALAVARINLERHALQARIRLLQGDGLSACSGPYQLILCNPPYVNAASMAALPAEFAAEPALALAGGQDGMDFVRQLLGQAHQYLSADGVLVLEIGHERAHFEAAFPHVSPLWLETSAGCDQVLLLSCAALRQAAEAAHT